MQEYSRKSLILNTLNFADVFAKPFSNRGKDKSGKSFSEKYVGAILAAMEDNEKVIDYLEQQIPELAAAATKIAYRQALASGSSVLISENGELVEVFPDGTREFVQKSEPYIKTVQRKFFINR